MPTWLVNVIALFVPALLGVVSGAASLFSDVDRAVTILNRYALYLAFPALIFAGIASSEGALPSEPGFWLVCPAVLALVAVGARLLFRAQSGTLALGTAFGNVAYLGLPVLAQVLGDTANETAAVAVAVHISLAVTVGPYLLVSWSGQTSADNGDKHPRLMNVVRQPLLWAPLVGFAAHLLPTGVRSVTVEVIRPVAHSAAPVALYLLGLFLWAHRKVLLERLSWGDVTHVVVKLLVVPGLTLGLCWLGARFEWLSVLQAQVLFVLSTMPIAITTFAMAQGLHTGGERMARAIVLSTLAAGLTVPVGAWLATHWMLTW